MGEPRGFYNIVSECLLQAMTFFSCSICLFIIYVSEKLMCNVLIYVLADDTMSERSSEHTL